MEHAQIVPIDTKTDSRSKKKKSVSAGLELSEEEEALFVAISFAKVHRIAALIDQVDKLDIRNMEQKTPLICVCEQMPAELATHVTRLMLKRKCNVNAHDPKGLTPLMYAVLDRSKADTVRILARDKRCDTNVMDENGYTALMHAVEHDNIEAIDILLFCTRVARPVDVNIHNLSGHTATDIAVLKRNPTFVHKLVRVAGADVSQVQDITRLNSLLSSMSGQSMA